MTLPLTTLEEDHFEEGLGFDGSSIRGWQGISESDMLLVPQADAPILDPYTALPTMSLLCEVIDPLTLEPYGSRPSPAREARRGPTCSRPASPDTAYFGPESEFFVFDSVSYDLTVNHAHYEVDSAEGHWNSGRDGPRLHDPAEGGLLPALARRTRSTICAVRW